MSESEALDPAPFWWVVPGAGDNFATGGLLALLFLLYLVILLYARFDRYTEAKGALTPLRTTIPTMLTVGLAYDLLPPLQSVNILVPLSLLAAAFARDVYLWNKASDQPYD